MTETDDGAGRITRSSNNLLKIKSSFDSIMGSRKTLEHQISILKQEEDRLNEWLTHAEEAKPALASMFENSSGPFLKEVEKAITSAIQGIIGGDAEVGIEATTLRNRMVAKIGTIIQLSAADGERALRSIFDSEGGALTNIVAFCLRAISTARSNQRRLLVIDEADCWMSNEKVRPFFQMVAEMAKLGGFQIIALTHHLDAIRELLDESNVIRIVRDDTLNEDGEVIKRGVARLIHEDNSYGLDDNPNYISSVTLKDFNGHHESHFKLSPGMNFIVGENNVGKSRILRALRCVALGVGEEADISSAKDKKGKEKFARKAHVIVNLSSYVAGTIRPLKRIDWTRNLKGSPAEIWEMRSYNEAGELSGTPDTSEEGEVCSVGKGRAQEAPVWIRSYEGLNIRPLTDDALCPQLHLQKIPSFALDKPERVLGELLAIGEKAARLREMMSLLAADVTNKNKELKTTKSRIDSLSEELNKTAFILRLKPILDTAFESERRINRQMEELSKVADIYERHLKYKHTYRKLLSILDRASIKKTEMKNLDVLFNLFNEYSNNKGRYSRNISILKNTHIKETVIVNTSHLFKIVSEHKEAEHIWKKSKDLLKKIPEIQDHNKIQEALKETDTVRKIMDNGRANKEVYLTRIKIIKLLSNCDIGRRSFVKTTNVRKILVSFMDNEQVYTSNMKLASALAIKQSKDDILNSIERNKACFYLHRDWNDQNNHRTKLLASASSLNDEREAILKSLPETCPTCGQVCMGHTSH